MKLEAFYLLFLFAFCVTFANEVKEGQCQVTPNIGLVYRPKVIKDPNIESSLIWFNTSNPEAYVDDLNNFFLENNSSETETHVLEEVCNNTNSADLNKSCENLNSSKAVSNHPCTKDESYGYKTAKPCILLQLNQTLDWVPVDYDESQVPQQIQGKYKKGNVLITCEGESPADKENIGNVVYYPSYGIPFKYFPYAKKHLKPFVWLQLSHPLRGVVINIECKAWTGNIKHDGNHTASVHFEVLVD